VLKYSVVDVVCCVTNKYLCLEYNQISLVYIRMAGMHSQVLFLIKNHESDVFMNGKNVTYQVRIMECVRIVI
jgi:hypothetical protein